MATDTPMQLGMVGLGRMGAGIVRRLMADGHHCVGYDRNPDVVAQLEGEGMTGAPTYEEFVSKLEVPRAGDPSGVPFVALTHVDQLDRSLLEQLGDPLRGEVQLHAPSVLDITPWDST